VLGIVRARAGAGGTITVKASGAGLRGAAVTLHSRPLATDNAGTQEFRPGIISQM
jgi:beta-galactosidase